MLVGGQDPMNFQERGGWVGGRGREGKFYSICLENPKSTFAHLNKNTEKEERPSSITIARLYIEDVSFSPIFKKYE